MIGTNLGLTYHFLFSSILLNHLDCTFVFIYLSYQKWICLLCKNSNAFQVYGLVFAMFSFEPHSYTCIEPIDSTYKTMTKKP